MPWKNTSRKPLQFPSGRTVKVDAEFTAKQAEGLNLRALQLGGTITWIEPKPEPKPKTKKK